MTKDLISRITYHLSSGGLFNPELADHLAVRNLLMECREALAQPEQEPVAYIRVSKTGHVMACAKTGDFFSLPHKTLLYTTPPQRKPLSDEEIEAMWPLRPTDSIIQFARAIEAAHGIKGET